MTTCAGVDFTRVRTPAYVIDLGALERNLRVLAQVQEAADCKVLLALKGFANKSCFGLVGNYLAGGAASSPHEVEHARAIGGEVHAYAPAYSDEDITAILPMVGHIVFNSPTQLRRVGARARRAGVSVGLRINPEHSEVRVPLYDPCAAGSRLGTTRGAWDAAGLQSADVDGLHLHSLCELGSDALERTLAAVEAKFGDILPDLAWLNLGGGHHITQPGYDRGLLVGLVRDLKQRFDLDVYLEPGEAIAIHTGVLVATVLDITHAAPGQLPVAILDTSATAHMPDVLEMPYRPEVRGAGPVGERAHAYRLGGLSCLAGDIIGDYSFDAPLVAGARVVFEDMTHYTMVKTTTFNGVRLPTIKLYDPSADTLRTVARFGYDAYASRVG